MDLFPLHFATTFCVLLGQAVRASFSPGCDPQLQGKAIAVCPQLRKCCALLVGFWKGTLLFG